MIGSIVLASILQGAFGVELLSISSSRNIVPCCQDAHAIFCSQVEINVDALGEEDIELPFDISVQFANMIPGNQLSYHYVGDNSEVVFTYNPISDSLYGHVSTLDGRSFVVENCGQDGHVFKEIDIANIGEDVAVVDETGGQQIDYDSNQPEMEQGGATFSVKFYYTPEFAEATADIDGFLDQVLSETNQGYMNSGVNLTITKHCSELATVSDGTDSYDTFDAFKTMKGDVAMLRGTADVAALITSNTVGNICGLGSLNVIASGNTVSLTAKPCALGYYSFGHEVGHNIGLHHDPATSTNTYYPYGHGHLIAAGNGNPGLRTILAYYADGHSTRVNYYSNPDINHPSTGTPLGVDGLSDNARLLNEKATSLAAIGDESETCGDGNSTTYCGMPLTVPKMIRFNTIKKISTPEECNGLCADDMNCEFWSWKNGTKPKKQVCKFYQGGLKNHKTLTSGPATC